MRLRTVMPSSPASSLRGEWCVRRTGASVALLLLAAATVRAQHTYTGPSKCVGCHDHERQATRWQKEEPALFKDKAHYNTRKQLDAPKGAAYAKAIGLADPYDLKGSCVKCHATVYRGDANAGVSCESCHGGASGYMDIHQVKGSYARAVAAGMVDLKERAATIGRVCVECHVTPDKRLAAAGHPTGADFDAGVNLRKIVHWATTYNYAQVTAAGKTAMAGRAPAGGGAPPASAVATPGTGTPRVRKEPGPPSGAPAAPAAEPDPWDWDQPVRPLPSDYVPEPAQSAAPEAPAPPAAAPSVARPAPVRAPRRAPSSVPPSIAEETPLLDAPPGTALAPAVAPVEPAGKASGARPPAADVAELRGRAVALLDRLLRAGARTPDLPPPRKPSEFRGPESELFRLQDEVIALALEALRRP